jgi:hypothetical protein
VGDVEEHRERREQERDRCHQHQGERPRQRKRDDDRQQERAAEVGGDDQRPPSYAIGKLARRHAHDEERELPARRDRSHLERGGVERECCEQG